MDDATLSATIVAVLVVLVRQVAEIVHKTISDQETGWKGAVRDLAGYLALYRKNKP
jgi:hypothetical protein